jgi:MoaA/NifB/PqqE/SkfB family radical SAM enzyme
LRRDIEQILEHASLMGLTPSLATNGLLLNEETASRLAPHVMQFQVSLDSVRPEEYAELRGPAGGPHLALNAIENAAATGRNVRVVTVLNTRNIQHLEEIADAVNRSPASQWFLFVMQPSGRAAKAKVQNDLAIKDLDAARQRAAKLKSNMRENLAVCFWGDDADDGVAVYLTEDCRVALKNYRDDSFQDLDLGMGRSGGNDYRKVWRELDLEVKYATLKNFVSPHRTL